MRGVYEIRDVVHQISLLGIAHDAAILLLDMRTDALGALKRIRVLVFTQVE